MRGGLFKGVVLGAVVSTVVLAASAAYAGTGIGAVFNLGQKNAVNATSTLQGSSSKTLQLNNSGSGPALGLHVQPGRSPLSTNSQAKVSNLNSDLLDGLNASDFQLKSDTVRINSNLSEDTSLDYDVGAGRTLTIQTSCDFSGGVVHSTVSLLNNAPGTGFLGVNDELSNGTGDPATTFLFSTSVASGNSAQISQADNPPPTGNQGKINFVTFVWRDSTQNLTATYISQAFTNFCVIEGSASRTT